jgi:hypothetical protein
MVTISYFRPFISLTPIKRKKKPNKIYTLKHQTYFEDFYHYKDENGAHHILQCLGGKYVRIELIIPNNTNTNEIIEAFKQFHKKNHA